MQQDTSPLRITNYHLQNRGPLSLPLTFKDGQHQTSIDTEGSSSTIPAGEGAGHSAGQGPSIDIQVTQPTPNISPSASLRSITGDDQTNTDIQAAPSNKVTVVSRTTAISATASNISTSKQTGTTMISNTPSIAPTSPSNFGEDSISEPTGVTPLGGNKRKDGVRRRVSFSGDETGDPDDNSANYAEGAETTSSMTSLGNKSADSLCTSPTSARKRKAGPAGNILRTQLTIPMTTHSNTMSYLQVPGQQSAMVPQTTVAPPLSPEAKRAQTSSQARNRRGTRLMKVGSFCSITSEGDGDIFEPTGELKENEMDITWATSNYQPIPSQSPATSEDKNVASSRSPDMRKPSDPLSDYSEFLHDDCHSDISELFGHKSPNKLPSTSTRQSTDSSGENDHRVQGTSVYNFSIDQEDIVFIEVPYKDRHQLPGQQAIQPTSSFSDCIENSSPRQQSFPIKDRKSRVDVGVQSPPPIPKNGNQQPEEPKKHKKGSGDTKKRRRLNESKKESFIMPDITVHNDGQAECEVEEELYESSSCSISVGSDTESSHRVITVPVTIEHPPPEMRPKDEQLPLHHSIQEKSTRSSKKQKPSHDRSGKAQAESTRHVGKQTSKSSSQHHHHHHHHHRHHHRQGNSKSVESHTVKDYLGKKSDSDTQDVAALRNRKGQPAQTDATTFVKHISTSDAGCQQAVPSSFVSRYYATSASLPAQGYKMIKSAGCSPLPKVKNDHRPDGIRSDEPQRRAPITIEEACEPNLKDLFTFTDATEVDESVEKVSKKTSKDNSGDVSSASATNTGTGVRMVLVRDIGIQVSGNSPNLNLYRRFFKKPSHVSQQQSTSTGVVTSFGPNNPRQHQAYHVNVPGNNDGFATRGMATSTTLVGSTPALLIRTSSSSRMTASCSTVTRPTTNTTSGPQVATAPLTSALSKSAPLDNKTDSTKNFPPEILF